MKLEIQITSLRRNSVSWFQKAETMRNIVTLCVLIVGCGLVATDDEGDDFHYQLLPSGNGVSLYKIITY